MEPQTQTKTSKDTVTMTVEIPKSSRSKLGRIKGIYGCDSLACAVSSVIDDIVIPDVLRLVADREVVTNELSKNDPIVTPEPFTSGDKEKIEFGDFLLKHFNESTINDLTKSGKIRIGNNSMRSTDEQGVIDLLKDRLDDLHVKDMEELALFIETDIIKIRNTQLPQISPAGEMPDDPEIWED